MLPHRAGTTFTAACRQHACTRRLRPGSDVRQHGGHANAATGAPTMTDGPAQLSLDRMAPAQATDGLFFAIFPDGSAAARIASIAQSLRAGEGLLGRPQPADRLHATLHHIGGHIGLRTDLVAAAETATARVAMAPFEVAFDSASSFGGAQATCRWYCAPAAGPGRWRRCMPRSARRWQQQGWGAGSSRPSSRMSPCCTTVAASRLGRSSRLRGPCASSCSCTACSAGPSTACSAAGRCADRQVPGNRNRAASP